MPRRVFFSFKYQHDVSRAMVVQPIASRLNGPGASRSAATRMCA